jgi:hypothetical protein
MSQALATSRRRREVADTGGPDRRRWLILGVIAAAQLMIVLDVTVMNLALP